jgi:enoyl-CoA hydratase/carnithine racemase
MSALIQARLTPQTAHESMATARRYGGQEALAAAIVDRVVDEDAVRGTLKTRMYAPALNALRDKDSPLG